jgi:hypothetical protein
VEDIRLITARPEAFSTVKQIHVEIEESTVRGQKIGLSRFDKNTVPIFYACERCKAHLLFSDLIIQSIKQRNLTAKETYVCNGEEWAGRRCVHLFEVSLSIEYL